VREQTCAEDKHLGAKSERSFEASEAGARSGIPRWSGNARMVSASLQRALLKIGRSMFNLSAVGIAKVDVGCSFSHSCGSRYSDAKKFSLRLRASAGKY
jgi:hypothetical protein